MGNGLAKQCAATLKNGQRCTRKAHKGSRFCGTTAHQAQGMETSSPAPAPAGAPAHNPAAPTDINYSADYQRLIDLCIAEEQSPTDNSTKVQWGQLHLRVLIAAKEERRLLEAQYITYHIVYEDPLEPFDEVPPMPELPPPEGSA
jgi:hypothetical protein